MLGVSLVVEAGTRLLTPRVALVRRQLRVPRIAYCLDRVGRSQSRRLLRLALDDHGRLTKCNKLASCLVPLPSLGECNLRVKPDGEGATLQCKR